MNDVNQQLQQQEVEIEDARKAVAKRDALLRLNQNEDFKKIFLEGFFKEDAARVVGAMANPETYQNRDAQIMFQNRLTAIGDVQQYLRFILQYGAQMDEALVDYEDTRDELAAEALNS